MRCLTRGHSSTGLPAAPPRCRDRRRLRRRSSQTRRAPILRNSSSMTVRSRVRRTRWRSSSRTPHRPPMRDRIRPPTSARPSRSTAQARPTSTEMRSPLPGTSSHVQPGSGAVLLGQTSVNPTFVVDVPGTYVARLIVNDGVAASVADTVVINTDNSAPVANAGPDQATAVAQTVTLNGSASSDIDGDPLTFAWAFVLRPGGSAAVLTTRPPCSRSSSSTCPARIVCGSWSTTAPSTAPPTSSTSPARTPRRRPTPVPINRRR